MAVLEGKSTTERNKMIVAAVLGLVALIALYLAFGRSLFGSSTPTATTKTSPTPRPSVSPGSNRDDKPLPTANEQDFVYQTTTVDYRPSSGGPEPGRNIFAFYEPPPPTPYSPTPLPPLPTQAPQTPAPTPPIILAAINPQAIYAGSPGFRLEAIGQFIPADARIYFNQAEMPTTFINDQKLVADIPANLIAQEGPRQIIVQTPDGKLISNQLMWTVAAPPRPGFQYIGMIARKRYNNDTAYFTENGKPNPFGARLNDVVGGRFRLVDISAAEVVFEDVSLGFRHRVSISKTTTSGAGTGQPGRPGFNNDPGFSPNNPSVNPFDGSPCVPGIPCNVPRYVPPQPKRTPDKNEDVDDNDDGDGDEN